jgi:Fe-S-cluster containining protein
MTQTAKIRVHLRTEGWAIAAGLTVPSEPAPVEIWLPFLQALASQLSAKAQETAAAEGQPVSCTKGCGACCRQPVGITLVEARALARLVAHAPEPRQGEIRRRFADGVARLRASGVLASDHADPAPEFPLAVTSQQRLGAAWFALQIACPFLEDEACGVYEDRPLVCREHLVTSPASACARLFRDPVDRIELPVRLADALMRTAAKLAGVEARTIPLMFALSLTPEAHDALAQPHDPRQMLETLLGEIGEWRIEPAT